MPVTADVWIDVHQERESLFALLETLPSAEWDEPSLCMEWRVRDVVGHMVSETIMTVPKVFKGTIACGFRINRFIAKDARDRGNLPITELVEDFRQAVSSRSHLPGLSSLSMLEDIIIHSLDIRRPLHREHVVPENRMVMVAADLRASHYFPGRNLFRGVRIMANDADWCAGEGPEVNGPIESLLLAMSGRLVGLEKLQGDGMATVSERVKHL